MFKASLACNSGVFVESLLYALFAALYEILSMLSEIFTSFAIPALADDIQLPTFAATLSNLQVSICSLAGVAASFVPFSFSCSSQAGAGSNPNGQLAATPPVAWGTPVELAPLPIRAPFQICNFNRTQWAAGGTSSCNCASPIWNSSTIDQLMNTLSTPACVLQCANYLWPLPFSFGARFVPSYITSTYPHPLQVRSLPSLFLTRAG
jgi:hypothetical protein